MVMSESKAIRKKLMAATSMLLVACIMLISASYAWFTLSTAPEITGISTAVGANGNLEIALADSTTWKDPDTLVQSKVGETGQAANITWGNLVDLSYTSYGLDAITLYPSRLAVNANEDGGYAVNTSPLATPVYSTDGRVDSLQTVTSYATYNGTGFTAIDDKDIYTHGVRGIGSASGMTDRQMAFRNAKIALANAVSQAKVIAKASLVNNGDTLANIIVEKAMDDNVKYEVADVKAIRAVITSLENSYGQLKTAWENIVLGTAVSGANAQTDTEVLAFAAVFPSNDYTVNTTDGTLTVAGKTISLETNTVTYYTNMTAILTKINAASTALKTIEDEIAAADDETTVEIEWGDISPALNYIVDSNKVKINDKEALALKSNVGDLVTDVTNGTGINVQMYSGAGVYADIADFCGDYSAAVTLRNLTYDNITVEKMDATMTTVTSIKPAYYVAATKAVQSLDVPSGDGADNSALTDMFGYAIDFYLRTNAADSNLELQTAAAQRIYSDSVNEETQGAGSNMEFTFGDTQFTADQVKNLMSAIRVVFTDGSGNILGIAKLDTANAKTVNVTVKADLKLCAFSFNTATDSNNNTIYTSLKIEDAVDQTEEEEEVFDYLKDQTLTSLPQNQAVKVTALVYLDGDLVDNADVAASALQSMTGKMNLQFTSDANLVPMDDSALNIKGTSTTE